MCNVLVSNGYQVEMLEEVPRVSSPDIRINGKPAELKQTYNYKNIYHYGHKARRQGAELVVFELPEINELYRRELNSLSLEGIKCIVIVDREVIIP